jgi:RNA polymerase sigma-70 factor, ECF subfamily
MTLALGPAGPGHPNPSLYAPVVRRGSGEALRTHGEDIAQMNVATNPEAELVARLREGDEVAFTALVDRHGPGMLRVARLYCTDSVAEEVVQETWIGVLQGLDKFEGRASLRTWIYRILVNIARTRGGREHRQVPFSAFVDAARDNEAAVEAERFHPASHEWPGHWVSFPRHWDEAPEERYLSSEGAGMILAALEILPPAQREVVTLRDINGWSSDEVCEALGISSANQRVLLHRGRSKIRSAIERFSEEACGARYETDTASGKAS